MSADGEQIKIKAEGDFFRRFIFRARECYLVNDRFAVNNKSSTTTICSYEVLK